MIRITRSGRTALIEIDRPEALNALRRADVAAFAERYATVDLDAGVGVIVITGAGERAFSAGADITEFSGERSAESALRSTMQQILHRVSTGVTPTIAAINGYALGGGLELALACDIRIAADTASVGLPELGVSVLPAAGGTQRLSRLIGPGRALEMMLTGRRVAAEEALSMGLVTAVHPAGELRQRAMELAEVILSKAPIAVRLARLAVRMSGESSMEAGLAVESLAQAVLFGTEDMTEGVRAFDEKRPPRFEGR